MEDIKKIKGIIEALLIVSEAGLSREDILRAISEVDSKDVEEALTALKEEYDRERAFDIAEIAGRCRIVTKPEYMPWINSLYQKEIEKLTGPSLETLAIIAYKQPVTRAEVESIRGVNVGGMMKTLLERNLITVKGRKDVLGRPLLYGTTEKFLEIFGMNSLLDLPVLRDFSEEDLEFVKAERESLTLENTKDEGREMKDELEGEVGDEPQEC